MMHRRGVLPAREVEGFPLLEALRWVIELEKDQVMFECDAKELVDCLKGDVIDHTKFGELVRRCKDLLASREWF
ncbi:hypothetical protein LINPERHAP2_LOCUS35670 [Linum perenne]